MKIGRRKIYEFNALSRMGVHSIPSRKKLFRKSQLLIDRIAGKSSGKRPLLDGSRMYMRKDENGDTMSLYFGESEGGCIVLNIAYIKRNADFLHFPKLGKSLSADCGPFPDSQLEFAGRYLDSPVRDRVVYRPAFSRPLDNLEEIVRITDDWKLHEKNGKPVYLLPNGEATIFAPEKVIETAGLDFRIVDEEFAEMAHIVSVPNRFAGWRKYLDLVHRAYGADAKKDIARLLVTLELEKRIWAEQIEGISRFLTLAREHAGGPLTIFVNGMTAAANGNRFSEFDRLDKEEGAIIDEIRRNSPRDTRFLRGFGKTMEEKIETLRCYGFYVGPFGSSSVISTVLDIPGVTYQNRHYINRTRKAPRIRHRIKVPAGKIRNIENKEGIAANDREIVGAASHSEKSMVGYSMDPDVFAKLAIRHYRKVSKLKSPNGPA